MQPKAAKKSIKQSTHTHQRKNEEWCILTCVRFITFFRFCYGHERELTDEADIP